MGLFSGKKTIMVSSVAYNMAGDPKDRIQYLPTAIVGGVLTDPQFSAGYTINSSMLSGPGIKMRSFQRWSQFHHYDDAIGLVDTHLILGDSINLPALAGQIPHSPTQTVKIQTAEIGPADYGYWADQWMLQNHPEKVNDDYVIDFDEVANVITMTFPDTTVYSFSPVGFDPLAQYLYSSYNFVEFPSFGPLITGTTHVVSSPAGYPSTVGWTYNGTTSVPGSMPLNTTVQTDVTYSDARPPEHSTVVTPSTGTYNNTDAFYEKKTYLGESIGLIDSLLSTTAFQHNMTNGVLISTTPPPVVTTETIAGGVIKTTTVTTTTESVGTEYSYRIDNQDSTEKSWSVMQVLIYKYQTGNPVLDAMFMPKDNFGNFFPFIPVRMWNQFLSTTFYPDIYAQNKKAYKKAVGTMGNKKYDELVASIADNESIGDVDFAHVVYGVSLNTVEKSSKKYVYKFFQTVMQQGAGGVDAYLSWQSQWAVANTSALNWKAWKEAQSNSGDPLFGAPEPVKIPYPAVPIQNVQMYSTTMNFNMIIAWSSLEEHTGVGLGKPDAKIGDLWWSRGTTITYSEYLYGGKNGSHEGFREIVREHPILNWQDGVNSYRSISMIGLTHINIVYKGKGVDTSALSALDDPEESGFIIPLHDGILKTMSLKDSTQMSTACTYLVFNCYQVVKQKWYQTSWFKVVLIIVVIVLTVICAPAGAATGAGVLGSAATVGAAIGFTGTVAIIVGAIANAIAAMLITKIVTAGATALFGDKVGAIVGAIGSVIAVAYAGGYVSGQSMATSFSSLGSAQNLLKLTIAAGQGYSEYMKADLNEIQKETENLLKNYESETKRIAQAYNENLGGSGVVFDPASLTNALDLVPEGANAFLSRTLMTGDDIASMTNSMIANFASMTTATELPV